MIYLMKTDEQQCPRGHAARRKSDGKCSACVNEGARRRHAARMQDPAYAAARKIDGQERKAVRRADPVLAERDRIAEIQRRQARRSDPGYRELEREAHRQRLLDPEVRARDKATGKKRREDPAVRARMHTNWLRSEYRMGDSDYADLLDAQGGHCALCSATRHSKGAQRRIGVDHEHRKGGRVRGLLCHACNVTLGLNGDSFESVAAGPFSTPLVLAYLRGPRDPSIAGLIAWYRAGGPAQTWTPYIVAAKGA